MASRFVTTEYASLTRDGTPITFPVTPYPGDGTLDVSTGLTYPLKAERARSRSRVALGFSDPTGSGLGEGPDGSGAPCIIVKGLATVRDADLVETSSRYLRAGAEKFPDGPDVPSIVMARMGWYWTRIWIEVTPVEVLWWPDGRLDQAPRRWRADDGTTAPPSDPAPHGRSSGSWSSDAGGVARADRGHRGSLRSTGRDAGGRRRMAAPVPGPRRRAAAGDGFVVQPPVGVPVHDGPACVTFHRHGDAMQFQENVSLVADAHAVSRRARAAGWSGR